MKSLIPRKHKRRNKYTADRFLDAAEHGNIERVAASLTHGVDVNVTNGAKETALMLATFFHRFDVASFLLNNGADVTKVSAGYTALHIAAEANSEVMARHLINNGANVNEANNANSWTPLHEAASNNSINVARTLLLHGANVNHRDASSMTALHIAVFFGNSILSKLLIDSGANINETCTWHNIPDRTALHLAALRGNQDIARDLLKQGADATMKDADGHTAAYYAENNAVTRFILIPSTFQSRLDDINFTGEVPQKYCCPISLSIMNDPIAVSSGRTYDRDSLKDWFKSNGNPEFIPDPETRDRIARIELRNKTHILTKDEIKTFVAAKEAEHKMQNTKKTKMKKPKPGPKLFDSKPTQANNSNEENQHSRNRLV